MEKLTTNFYSTKLKFLVIFDTNKSLPVIAYIYTHIVLRGVQVAYEHYTQQKGIFMHYTNKPQTLWL